MPYMRVISALLLTLCALSLPFAIAAEEPAAPAPKAGEDGAAAPPPPPPRPFDSVPLPTLTANALGAEQRLLKTADGEFPVYVRARSAGKPRGTVLLLPGDGNHPGAAPGIDRLGEELRPFGWTTWLVALEPPPRVRLARMPRDVGAAPPAATGTDATAAEQPAKDDKPATAEAKADEKTEAPATGEASAAESPDSAPDAERLQQWLAAGLARIGAAVEAAGSDGEVVIVAAGSTAVLLRNYLTQHAGAAVPRATVFIRPVDLAGLGIPWPTGLATPVLEVLSLGQRETDGTALRREADRLGLRHYRQVAIEPGGVPDGSESLLTRTVRGWLRALPKPAAEPRQQREPEPSPATGTKV